MAPTVYLPAIDSQAWLISTYHYEHMNRLTKIKTDSNANDVAEFRYDGLGRRIVMIDCIADGGLKIGKINQICR